MGLSGCKGDKYIAPIDLFAEGGGQKVKGPVYHRHPIILSENDWGVQSPSKRIVFRLHYHSQKVIGSLGLLDVGHIL